MFSKPVRPCDEAPARQQFRITTTVRPRRRSDYDSCYSDGHFSFPATFSTAASSVFGAPTAGSVFGPVASSSSSSSSAPSSSSKRASSSTSSSSSYLLGAAEDASARLAEAWESAVALSNYMMVAASAESTATSSRPRTTTSRTDECCTPKTAAQEINGHSRFPSRRSPPSPRGLVPPTLLPTVSQLKMKSADLEGEHSVSGDARESKSYFPEVQKVSAADIGERLAGADPYWRHLLETLLLNATVAKSVAALAVTGKFFPFVALASSTAVAPAPPRANANRQIATVPGPGSDRSWALTNANGQPKEEEQFMELIFPGFDGDTFIWNVTLAQIAAFAFTMWVGHQKANPTPCALYLLGASWGPALARGQLWRLVCPMMLHANMMHLFFNVFFQLRIGFGMEKQFGKSKMRSLYVMCGVIGNLISVMLDPFKLAVGASTAGFGLIGVWIAEIVMSWDQLGANRDRTLIWILFMLVSVTTMSGMTPNMDLYGHFGGALGGFLMALIMSDMKPEQRPPWYNAMKKLGFAGLAGILGAGIWKVGFHTPLSPIPDCSMFGALFSKLM